MKAICIIRTSTQSQEIESQREEIINYAKSFGYSDEDIKVIGKQGASAIKVDESYQANIEELFATIEADKGIEVVFAWAIDRIGRKQTLLHSIKDFLVEHRVNLIIKNPALKLMDNDGSVNDGVDLAFSLFAAMAEQEMKHKKERFARARTRNQSIGKYNGGKVKYGYKVDENSFLVVDERESDEVQLIFNMYCTGKYSIAELMEELDQMGIHISNKGRLHKVLTDKAYIGQGIQKLSPIVSEEQFNKAQEILKKNQLHKDRQSKRYYFAVKLLKCPDCGHNYIVDGKVYRCYGRREGECENSLSISHKFLDGLLWTVASVNHNRFISKKHTEVAKELEKEIERLDIKIANYSCIEETFRAKKQKVQEGYEEGIYTKEERATRIANLNTKYMEQAAELKGFEAKREAFKEQIKELATTDEKAIKYRLMIEDLNKVGTKTNSKDMFDIVHKHIEKVELRAVEGKIKATQITITLYNGDIWNYLYIPYLKGDGSKLFIINDKEVLSAEHYIIDRDENDMVTATFAHGTKEQYIKKVEDRIRQMKKGEAN